MTSYTTTLNSDVFVLSIPTNNTISDVIVIDGGNVAGKKALGSGTASTGLLKYYIHTSQANPASNIVMRYGTGTSQLDSTSSGNGYGNVTTTAPLRSFGSAASDTNILISNACTLSATAITFPVYCWIAVFRNDFNSRYCVAFVEYSIPSGNVNNNATFSAAGIMGEYQTNRVLIPNNDTTTPSFTVGTSVPLGAGRMIGVEVLKPTDSAGIATVTISTHSNLGVLSNITYSTALPFSRFLGGFFKHTSVVLAVV